MYFIFVLELTKIFIFKIAHLPPRYCCARETINQIYPLEGCWNLNHNIYKYVLC